MKFLFQRDGAVNGKSLLVVEDIYYYIVYHGSGVLKANAFSLPFLKNGDRLIS
jgi:hypothetical protein